MQVGARVDLRELRKLDELANKRAVRHYRNVLVAARRRGLRPFITINHFSLPLWIHDPIAVRNAFAGVGLDDPLPRGLERAGWLERTPPPSSASTPPTWPGSTARSWTCGIRSTSRSW